LGQHLREQSNAVRSVQKDKQSAAQLEARILEEGGEKAGFERFSKRDPDALMTQSEAAFERVVKEFADIPGSRGGTLGEEAGAELNERRNLVPGKPAPEVTGADVDGRPLKLSDHRGRVVLLSFWGKNWGSLRGQIPNERALVARMRDRPFEILGVNDDDKETLRALIKKEDITWLSWWDRGRDATTPGPIARQFNINVRPTLYLIDHRGIIRQKYTGSTDPGKLDAAIDELVATAERDPGAAGSP
jgi:peroxiredoxin